PTVYVSSVPVRQIDHQRPAVAYRGVGGASRHERLVIAEIGWPLVAGPGGTGARRRIHVVRSELAAIRPMVVISRWTHAFAPFVREGKRTHAVRRVAGKNAGGRRRFHGL